MCKILVALVAAMCLVYGRYCYESNAEEPLMYVQVLNSPVPNARSFKSWMPYTAITSHNSGQWRMQQIAYTCEDGFRRIDGLYMIALGTYFLSHYGVGDVFEITLSEGRIFRAVVGDVKANRHTDATNRFTAHNGCMLEFIVCRPNMPEMARRMGDISFAGFEGYVVNMVRLHELFIVV